MLGQLVGQNGDEDQIVDPQHYFHDDKGGEGCQCRRIRKEREKVLHCPAVWGIVIEIQVRVCAMVAYSLRRNQFVSQRLAAFDGAP